MKCGVRRIEMQLGEKVGGGERRGSTRKMRHANHRELGGISKSIYIYIFIYV